MKRQLGARVAPLCRTTTRLHSASSTSSPLIFTRTLLGLPSEEVEKYLPKQWKSSFNQEYRDWRDPNKLVIHNHPQSPYYSLVHSEPAYGAKDAYPLGIDPPYPHLPINKNNSYPYAWQPEVLSVKNGYIKYALLNRPMAYHSLNLPAVRTLASLLKKWDLHKKTTHGILMSSSTGDDFCAGSDFIDIYNAVQRGDIQHAKVFFRELYGLMSVIKNLKKPYFPIMHGYTMGSGAALAFNSESFRITTEAAIFAMPEVGIGFIPDCGATHFLAQLPDEIGTFLALTGKRMRGWDLLHAGIATHVVTEERMKYFCEAMGDVYSPDRSSIRIMDALYLNISSPLDHPFLFEKRGYKDIVKRCFNKDTVQEIMDALEYEFEPWAHVALKAMQSNCPLSMAVTLRLLRQAKTSTLGEALDGEYRAATRLITMPDFAEGVRARLVEKRQPKWSHDRPASVTNEEIDRILAPLPAGEELDGVTLTAAYMRRMADVDNFIDVQYSELCYSILKNKLMAITQLRKERDNLRARIAAEVRPESKKLLEDELVVLDKELKTNEAIDPENPPQEMRDVLTKARAHLEQLARGKISKEDFKAKAQELYKVWVEGTKGRPRIKESKPVEQADKEIYAWSKFFKKDAPAEGANPAQDDKAGAKPGRLGDRLAEKLKAMNSGDGTTPSPFAPRVAASDKSGGSLADKLFGPSTRVAGAAGGEGKAVSPLTESLLAAVSQQAKLDKDPVADLFPSTTIADSQWKTLADQWDRWALPLYEQDEPKIVYTEDLGGADKFNAWVNEKMKSPAQKAEELRKKGHKWRIDLKKLKEYVGTNASVWADRHMLLHRKAFPPISRPFAYPFRSYFEHMSTYYFRDRITDPMHLLNRDLAYGLYGRSSGEMSTWKQRISVRDSMERKWEEVSYHMGNSFESLDQFEVDVATYEAQLDPAVRHVQDIDLVMAYALKDWSMTGTMPLLSFHDVQAARTAEQLEVTFPEDVEDMESKLDREDLNVWDEPPGEEDEDEITF